MNVESIKFSQKNIHQQMPLQLILTLTSRLILLLFLTSCVVEPKPKKAQLGQEISINQVYKALDDAMDNRSPSDSQVGDQVLYEINQRVETSAVTKLKEIRTEVRTRKEERNTVTYLLDKTVVDYQGDKPEIVRTEEEWRVAKAKSSEKLSASFHPLTLYPLTLHPLTLLSSFQKKPVKTPSVTYHNLQLTHGIRPVPAAAVKNLPECSEQSLCQLNVTEVNFDIVHWPSAKDWKTSHYRYIYTSDTPYLAHLVLFCVKSLVDAKTRDYFVSRCKVLRDFIAGPVPNKK